MKNYVVTNKNRFLTSYRTWTKNPIRAHIFNDVMDAIPFAHPDPDSKLIENYGEHNEREIPILRGSKNG